MVTEAQLRLALFLHWCSSLKGTLRNFCFLLMDRNYSPFIMLTVTYSQRLKSFTVRVWHNRKLKWAKPWRHITSIEALSPCPSPFVQPVTGRPAPGLSLGSGKTSSGSLSPQSIRMAPADNRARNYKFFF